MQTKYKKLNYVYDKSQVLDEIYKNTEKFYEILALKENFKKRPFSIVPDEFYERVDSRHPYNKEFNGKKIPGTISSWEGYNFTYVPGDRDSVYGRNSDRAKGQEWMWKPEVTCDYLKKIVQDLGFVSIQNIRAMIINPGGFGPVHKDDSESSYYKKYTSVTLNLEDGGQPLTAQIDGEFYEFNDPCFIFEDDCWHGVGQVSSRRTQVRINGIVNQDILSSYLSQPDRALLPALMMLSSV
jgi:hypothetical protein